jgi:ferredoxin
MGLDVMSCMAAVIRGDLVQATELSLECVMCGLCAARCPAELAPFNVALLARRIHGRGLGRAESFDQRLKDIESGLYAPELSELKSLDQSGIKDRFQEYQATKGAAV